MDRTNNLLLSLLVALSFASLSHAGNVKVPEQAPTINEGLAMAGPGGTVTVKKGTYFENVIVPFVNQTLRADGKVTVDGGGATGIYAPPDATGVSIEDMRVRNCSTGIYIKGDYGTVDDCQVRFAVNYGILLWGSDNTTVKDVKIKDTGLHGVYLLNSNNCVVERCRITRAGGKGVYVLGNVNSILGNKIRYAAEEGIQLGSGSDAAIGNLVEDNDISDAHRDAIECERMAASCVIQKNVIRGSGDDGIDIRYLSHGHSVLRNKTYDSGDDGIEVDGDNCTVSRNKSWRSFGDGISVQGNSDNGLYSKNKVKHSLGEGLEVWGVSNTFTQNKMKHSLSWDLYSAVAFGLNTWINNKFDTSNL